MCSVLVRWLWWNNEHVQQSVQMFRCVQYWYNGGGGTMNMFSNYFKCLDVFSIGTMAVEEQ